MNNPAVTIARDNEGKSVLRFLAGELKPRGKWLTPFNIISIPVIILGLVLIVIRFWKGIGSITNLSQEIPWGLGLALMWLPVCFRRWCLCNHFYGIYPENE